jgi:hypothetical protein
LEIRYTPTFADYRALNIHVMRRQLRFLLPFAALALVAYILYPFILQSPFVLQPPDYQVSAVDCYRSNWCLLILPGMVLYCMVATLRRAKKRWISAQELREERRLQIDSVGVRANMKSGDSFTDWSVFKTALITKRFVYLTTAQQAFLCFPVSAVPEMPELCALIRSKVADTKIIP